MGIFNAQRSMKSVGNRADKIEADGLIDFSQGNGHLIFYRFERNTQKLGCFFIPETVFFDELKDQLASWWQLPDGEVNSLEHFSRDHQLLGIKINALYFNNAIVQREGPVPFFLYQTIDGKIFCTDIKIQMLVPDLQQ
jgi:hypothetical protein